MKITRLRHDHIRVTGMAEICGFDLELRDARATIARVVSDLFPAGGDLSDRILVLSGPMTPDGTPVIGATDVRPPFSTLAGTRSAGPWPAVRPSS